MNTKFLFVSAAIAATAFSCAHKTDVAQSDRAPNRSIANDNYVEPLYENDYAKISTLTLQEKGGKNNDDLENCGGHATLVRENGNLHLLIRDSNCGSYSLSDGIERRLDGKGNDKRSKTLKVNEIPGTTQEFTVAGGKYYSSHFREGSADRIHVIIPSPPPQKLTLDLRNFTGTALDQWMPGCTGYIRAAIQNNKVNVVISDTNCGLFDILSNEGASLDYDHKPIPYNPKTEKYGGGFQLPKVVYDRNLGYNGVQVRVYNAGGADVRALIQFNVR